MRWVLILETRMTMGFFKHVFPVITVSALLSTGFSRTLEVGPGKPYGMPSQAAAAAKDGDTVLFSPTVFAADAATWNANNLVLRSSGPFAHMKAQGSHAGGKGTWVITGNNTLVENIEFSEAAVPDENGAGIRQEGNNLTIRYCYFHDNQNGILAGDAPASDILIEFTEFAKNGFGDGQTHNMYINHVKSFTLRYSYSHHAKVGHNIKTRAIKNYIICNRSLDGADGSASYELDMPNGGYAVVAGNVFQQGPATENPTLMSYGAEGVTNPNSSVQIINNTFVNDRTNGGTFITLAPGTPAARIMNNLFVGPGTIVNGFKPDSSANLITQSPGFVDRNAYDYRLSASSPAIDKGRDPGSLDGAPLLPVMQLLPPLNLVPRKPVGEPDVGAFEYDGNIGIKTKRPKSGAARRPDKGFVAGLGLMFGEDEVVDGLGRDQTALARAKDPGR
jgi:hypothetical protein